MIPADRGPSTDADRGRNDRLWQLRHCSYGVELGRCEPGRYVHVCHWPQEHEMGRRETRSMRYWILTTLLLIGLASAAGCGGDDSDGTTTEVSQTPATKGLTGSGHRSQRWRELLTVFDDAGLAGSERDCMPGNFYGGSRA